MTSTTSVPATDKQMAFLRKLAAERGVDLRTHLIAEGIADTSWPSGDLVARVPSKKEASCLIDGFLSASGRPARSSSYGRRGRYSYVPRRGRCEDAPCCGCCS